MTIPSAAIDPNHAPPRMPVTMGRTRPGFDMVREAGPHENETVVHERNRRQRMADALHDTRDGTGARLLNDDQHATANALRDAWERSRHIQQLRAADVSRPVVDGGGGELNESETAQRLYEGTMRQVGREARHCLSAIVIHNESPDSYGERMRCDGLAILRRCLDRAARAMADFT